MQCLLSLYQLLLSLYQPWNLRFKPASAYLQGYYKSWQIHYKSVHITIMWISFHTFNFIVHTVNNATAMIETKVCLKKKPASLKTLAYFVRLFSPTHIQRSNLITFEIWVSFTWQRHFYTTDFNANFSPWNYRAFQKLTKLTLFLTFHDSAKNKMIQVNINLNFSLQRIITLQLLVSRQNPGSVASTLLDIFQETLPLFLPALLSYLMTYSALLSFSTSLSEWQCSLCSAKMKNSLIQSRPMFHFYTPHFYTRVFLTFSIGIEKDNNVG